MAPAVLQAQCVSPNIVEPATVIQIAPVLVVKSLEGFVVDGSGKKIKDARVEEKSEDGKNVIQSAMADASGHFALRSVNRTREHFLQISLPGGDVIQIHVIVRKSRGKTLTIRFPKRRDDGCDDLIL